MRYLINLLLAIALVACGGGGGGGGGSSPDRGTAPQLTELRLSRYTAFVMEGDGTGYITAEVDYFDPERDLAAVHVVVSDGTVLEIPIPGQVPDATGTIMGELSITTTAMGDFTAEVWIEDSAGNNSNRVNVNFSIIIDSAAWLVRESNLQYWLNDVTWSDSLFVAVGNGGTIITSPNGIDWTIQVSNTDVRLNEIEWLDSQFYAVGDSGTILLSPDGANWTTVNTGPDNYWLQAVTSSGDTMVAAGQIYPSGKAYMMTSLDGVMWTENPFVPQTGRYITDLAWSGQQYVATTAVQYTPNDGRVMTSVDGLTWVEVAISTQWTSTLSILWDGAQFVAGGVVGHMYMSPDGINWTELETPTSTNFMAVASSPYDLIALGNGQGCATRDGGDHWSTIFVASGFTSRGVVQGANRYVSVGVAGTGFGNGWIYSTR